MLCVCACLSVWLSPVQTGLWRCAGEKFFGGEDKTETRLSMPFFCFFFVHDGGLGIIF